MARSSASQASTGRATTTARAGRPDGTKRRYEDAELHRRHGASGPRRFLDHLVPQLPVLIRALHDQYGFTSVAKLVLLECCLSGLNTPASVANALEYAGVDCIIGWTINCPGSDPGYFELLDLMCNEGMRASDAYDQVCDDHSEWGEGKTRIIGDTYLWGEPL